MKKIIYFCDKCGGQVRRDMLFETDDFLLCLGCKEHFEKYQRRIGHICNNYFNDWADTIHKRDFTEQHIRYKTCVKVG